MPTPKSKHRQCSAEKQNAVETHFWSPRNAHHNQQLLPLSQARTPHRPTIKRNSTLLLMQKYTQIERKPNNYRDFLHIVCLIPPFVLYLLMIVRSQQQDNRLAQLLPYSHTQGFSQCNNAFLPALTTSHAIHILSFL